MTYTLDTLILSPSRTTARQKQAWLEARGRALAPTFAPDGQYKSPPADIGVIVEAEAARWQPATNSDVLMAMIDVESAAWQSALARDKNNPSGFGAEDHDPYNLAHTFPTPHRAIEATNAKLRNYAAGVGEWSSLDTRFDKIPTAWLGTTTRIRDLGNGRWATDPHYAGKILDRLNSLMTFSGTVEEPPMSAQIPGFAWFPAKATHYTKGRTQKIRGGAQHYTAGTNSLAWLTSTSGATDPSKRVSATCLVKHNPTMADRGWQLVRIEDTAWTTAFANPYTVSIEYEHTGQGTIPDIAYDVLAQTWLDITDYVTRHSLGSIDAIRGHKEWVNNPALTCPDGIDMARLNRRIEELRAPGGGGGSQTWPYVPRAQPDPWRDHLGGNPFDRNIWIPNMFLVNIAEQGGFDSVGFACSEGFVETNEDGVVLFVQYFERAKLELHESGMVTRARLGYQEMVRRYPERQAA